jgi:hypothetical protein
MYRIIGGDGREYGPVSAVQLQGWIAEGRLNADTRVLRPGSMEWQRLGAIPELFSLLPSTAAPSPRQTHGMATAGLILGAVSITVGLCCCYGMPFNLLGLIFSLVAWAQIRSAPEKYDGSGLAIAGAILSALSLILTVLMFGVMGVLTVLDEMN